MYVSKEVQARVQAKLVECIAILEKRYNQKFNMPRVIYNGQTRCAGLAWFEEWKIELSAPLLMDPANVDEMINDTTPHELAHLVTFKVYPHTNETSFQVTGRGFRRTKREVHGPHWQEVMWAMGVNPTRTHKMKVSAESFHAGNVRERKRYDWVCSGCKKTIQLGPKHNAAMLRDPNAVHHKGCRGNVLLKPGTVIETKKVGNLTIHRTVAPDVPPMPLKVPHIPEPTSSSKIDICKRVFQNNKLLTRAQMIKKFVEIAKCTPAGAATYYATCKNIYG